MAAVLADCELANCVTDIENELAIDDELAVPVTAAVSLDEKVLAPQVSLDSRSDAASPKLANCDFTVANADSCVSNLAALVCNVFSGCFSTSTNCVTMELMSRPLPTPGEEMDINPPVTDLD
jgi:hypothetical protein